MTRPRVSRKRIENAIPGSGGIIRVIAGRAGYTWHTVRDVIDADAELSRMLRDEQEAVDDMAEATLIGKIRDGDESVARWWLARRRRQIFGESVDVTSGGNPLTKIVLTWPEAGGDEE
jgi:hypothetical protein